MTSKIERLVLSLCFSLRVFPYSSTAYYYNRTPGTADGFDQKAVPGILFIPRKLGVKIVLKLLLGVVRQVIAKLMNQLILTMCL